MRSLETASKPAVRPAARETYQVVECGSVQELGLSLIEPGRRSGWSSAPWADEVKGMSTSETTPLAAVPGWPTELVEKLRGRWITTAQQVVAVGATPEGVRSLAEQLGIAPEAARQLIDRARDAIGPVRSAELERPADVADQGLGAIRPPAR
jgi:hypothetical protein